MVTRIISGIASVAILAAGGAGFWLLTQTEPGAAQSDQGGPMRQLVEVALAEEPAETPTITQTGFVQALREVDVAFEVQGRIARVANAFEVGRAVEEGTVLARIDTDRLEAAVEQAEADLASAEAQLQEAEATFRRQQELQQRDVTAEANVEDARAARDTAAAGVVQAEARVRSAQLDLNSAEVVAPFEGFVTARTASEGQIVSPGAAIGTLVRADTARVVVGLADRQVQAFGAPRALIGAEVAIRQTAGGGADLRTGEVVDVDVRIDQAARTTNYLVDLPDPFGTEPVVRIGQLVAVDLPLMTNTPLTQVAAAAVKDGDRVWVVTDDDTLRPETVRVVHRTDDLAYLADADALRGARLMTTDLAAPVEGTAVRVAEDDGDSAADAEATR